MKSLSSHLNEAVSNDNLYVDSFGTFWFAWGQGSGSTTPNILKNHVISNNKTVGKYDPHFCDEFIKNTTNLKIHRKKDTEFSTIRLFKIPVYDKYPDAYKRERYDVHGGDIKPKSFIYMSYTITGKNKEHIIVHAFKTLREATGFHEF